jgi:NDP-sugar pyrophosphorylase family protein
MISDRPKVLAGVGGRPFITYLFDQLATVKIKEVVLCTGYLGQQVYEALGEAYGPMNLRYSRESNPLGTGGALRMAMPLLKSELILVMNGDSYCEADLKAFCSIHRLRKASATILLKKMPDTRRFGCVNIEEDGRITAFAEKKEREEPGWINVGIYLIRKSLLETISPDRMVSLEQDIFPSWIGQGLYGFRSQGRFIDIGTPESFTLANQFFTRENSP